MAAVAVLARKGYSVTVFEGSDKVGGAAKLIPEARLPQAVIEKDWDFIKTFGDITLKMNHRVANPVDLLKDGYDGVIVAVGEPHTAKMGIPGEDLAVSFMDYLKEPEKYKTVATLPFWAAAPLRPIAPSRPKTRVRKTPKCSSAAAYPICV